jgi:hypothetical protein
MRGFVATFLLFPILPSLVQAQEQLQPDFPTSLSLRTVEVRLEPDVAEYSLPDSLLVPGSEAVWIADDTLASGADYTLDYVRGKLILLNTPAADSLLHVRYLRLPLVIPIRYSHRIPVVVSEDSLEQERIVTELSQRSRNRAQQEFAANLRKSGSLVRGVSIGSNQGLKVDSGLRMQLSGRLAKDVEVVASLTDQNTPIQPEGNTQTLREIDKVFVQIKASRMQATLGDFNLGYDGTQFARYQRKLQGAMASARFGNVEVAVSGAVSRGRYTTNQFLGQEGNQGPYQLRGERGEVNIIVLAGTERVYVDGELMTRGEDRDYVIEYGNGQITFTRNRLITADSRITVDFQYSAEHFRRNLYSARGQVRSLNDRLTIAATLIRETDDKDNPLDFTLRDNELARLQEAGDDPDAAVVDGWRFVGAGNGPYVRDEATGVFQYVGPGLGDYVVVFSFVGKGKGDYAFQGFGNYRYVGPGQGSYLPVILLTPAQSQDLADLNIRFEPRSDLQLTAEVASSVFDANLYSSRDDGDNRGLATHFGLLFQPQQLRLGDRSLGRFRLAARYRRKDSRFRDIDRTTIIEYNRQWDLPGELRSPEETVAELESTYEPAPGFSLRGSIGRLKKANSFRSNRWEFRARLDRSSLPQIDYRIENIDRQDRLTGSSGLWLRQRGKTSIGIGKLRPFVDFLGEIKKESLGDSLRTGFRFNDVTTGVELTRWRGMSLLAQFGLRDDDVREDGVFKDRSLATTRRIRWQLHRWRSLSADVSFAHRTRDFADPGVQNTRTDLADVRLTFSPLNRALESKWYYQINNTRVARQERVFIKVGEGQGNYRFDPNFNEYVPDPFGDYILRIFATNEFVPVVELRASTNLRFEPARLFGKGKPGFWKKYLTPLSTETLIRIEEKSREPDVWQIYRLNLDSFQQEETTLLGLIQLRQDLYLWRNRRDRSLRLRYENRRELNNQFLEGGQRRRSLEGSARLNLQLARRFGSQVDLIHRRQERRFSTRTRPDRDIVSNQAVFDLSYRPRPVLELALRSTLGMDRDREPQPDTRVRIIELAPRVSYALSRQGRLRAEAAWINVSSEPANRVIPFEMANGRRVGTTTTWNFSFNYRFSRNIMVTVSYTGRKEPGRPGVLHVGRAEMRAFF